MADLVQMKKRLIDAQNSYEGWGMLNTAGKSAEELVALDVGYAKAQKEFLAAYAAYHAALEQET